MSIIDCGWFPVILCFCMGGRRVSGVPLNYYMTGHASATSAHAAVHSIPKYKKETAVPFLYLGIQTLAVLKCPCHVIILDGTPKTCCTQQTQKI